MADATLDDLVRGRAVGRGVSSSVVVAAHRATGERYALKVIPKAHIKCQSQLAQIYREKDLLGALDHEGIVRFFRTLKDEGHLYYVLEYLAGGELLWHMRRAPRRRLAEPDARVCTGALLLPLRYMAEQGVLYRDLKPTNVVFSRSGRLKLVDFAHAKRVASVASERSDSLCGTHHYHAPETVRGEGHGLPAQLWALGVMIVEMLSGVPPFGYAAAADGLSALHERVLNAEPELESIDGAAVRLASVYMPRDVAVSPPLTVSDTRGAHRAGGACTRATHARRGRAPLPLRRRLLERDGAHVARRP